MSLAFIVNSSTFGSASRLAAVVHSPIICSAWLMSL